MRLKVPAVVFLLATLFAIAWYTVEPWALTFIDDGPYYSTNYFQPVDDLPMQSIVELRRLGADIYTLESRLMPDLDSCVLVLRDDKGQLLWSKIPLKPDGELGVIEFRGSNLTWNGGWRVRIFPSNQESGDLYIGFFGGFRFFNHSW